MILCDLVVKQQYDLRMTVTGKCIFLGKNEYKNKLNKGFCAVSLFPMQKSSCGIVYKELHI